MLFYCLVIVYVKCTLKNSRNFNILANRITFKKKKYIYLNI